MRSRVGAADLGHGLSVRSLYDTAMGQGNAEFVQSLTHPVDAEALRKKLEWERKEMASFLGVSARSYAHRLRTGRFDLGQRLKLEMLAVVFEDATEVLHGEEEASGWLRSPIYSLGSRRPIDYLESIRGFGTVRNTLRKIEYSMY